MHRQIYSSLTKFSVSLELEVQCVPLASVLAFLAGGLSESVQLDIYKSTKEKCVTRFKRQIIDQNLSKINKRLDLEVISTNDSEYNLK